MLHGVYFEEYLNSFWRCDLTQRTFMRLFHVLYILFFTLFYFIRCYQQKSWIYKRRSLWYYCYFMVFNFNKRTHLIPKTFVFGWGLLHFVRSFRSFSLVLSLFINAHSIYIMENLSSRTSNVLGVYVNNAKIVPKEEE